MHDKYFDRYFDMFTNEGWKQLLGECKEQFDQINLADVKNWDDYLIKRTEKVFLERFLNFEAMIRMHHNHQQETMNLEISDEH